MINPMGAQAQRAVDAAISGDPGKLAPAAPAINFNPNDPKAQQQAQAQVESTKDLGLALLGQGDPLALAKAAPAAATVLVNGDPNEVGQGAGRTFVIAGTAVALGGLGEVGAAEAGASEASGAAAEPVPAPQAPGAISSLDPALDPGFGEAPTQLAPQAPGEVSSAAESVPAP